MQSATFVTVPATVIVHEIPLWQVVAVGGAVILALLLLALIVVAALASFWRHKPTVEN